jgi:hypothetical protein
VEILLTDEGRIPSVGIDPCGRLVVAWEQISTTISNDQEDVFVTLLDAAGGTLTSGIPGTPYSFRAGLLFPARLPRPEQAADDLLQPNQESLAAHRPADSWPASRGRRNFLCL